jgi:ElaB/YqjD/DUF883 family membrane-anchored ribosome-binding protein
MADNRTSASVNGVAGRAKDAAEMAATRATDAVNSVKSAVQGAVDAVADRTTSAAEWTSDTLDSVRSGPTRLADSGAEYLRQKPYTYLIAAVAIAYLVGRLARR